MPQEAQRERGSPSLNNICYSFQQMCEYHAFMFKIDFGVVSSRKNYSFQKLFVDEALPWTLKYTLTSMW